MLLWPSESSVFGSNSIVDGHMDRDRDGHTAGSGPSFRGFSEFAKKHICKTEQFSTCSSPQATDALQCRHCENNRVKTFEIPQLREVQANRRRFESRAAGSVLRQPCAAASDRFLNRLDIYSASIPIGSIRSIADTASDIRQRLHRQRDQRLNEEAGVQMRGGLLS